MNGIHDVGGMHGLGPVPVDADEAFHADWERRVYGTNKLVRGQGLYNVDEFRHARERIPPVDYLRNTYFEQWAEAIELLLTEKGVLTGDAIEGRLAELDHSEDPEDVDPEPDDDERERLLALAEESFSGGAPADYEHRDPRFEAGDRVRVRNLNPGGHTRVPGYTRRAAGEVRKHLGTFPLADAAARGEEVLEPLYSVRFSARELWGEEYVETDAVNVDMWESYLEEEEG
jgi:nitrile hydratase